MGRVCGQLAVCLCVPSPTGDQSPGAGGAGAWTRSETLTRLEWPGLRGRSVPARAPGRTLGRGAGRCRWSRLGSAGRRVVLRPGSVRPGGHHAQRRALPPELLQGESRRPGLAVGLAAPCAGGEEHSLRWPLRPGPSPGHPVGGDTLAAPRRSQLSDVQTGGGVLRSGAPSSAGKKGAPLGAVGTVAPGEPLRGQGRAPEPASPRLDQPGRAGHSEPLPGPAWARGALGASAWTGLGARGTGSLCRLAQYRLFREGGLVPARWVPEKWLLLCYSRG